MSPNATELLDEDSLFELEFRLGHKALLRVLATQLRYCRELIARLEQAGEPPCTTVRHAVHQMAGSSGSVGLTKLGHAAVQLEQSLDRHPFEELRPRIAALCTLAKASLEALAARYPEAEIRRTTRRS